MSAKTGVYTSINSGGKRLFDSYNSNAPFHLHKFISLQAIVEKVVGFVGEGIKKNRTLSTRIMTKVLNTDRRWREWTSLLIYITFRPKNI